MGVTYTIKKGDTLSKIAKEYGTTVQAIAKENNISNPDLIYAGNTLTIGGNTKTNTGGNANNKSNTGGKTNTNTNNNNNAGSNKIVDGGTKEPVAGAPKVDEVKTVTSPAGFTYGDFSYATFDPMADEQIKQAWDILTQHNASNPGEFTDPNGYKDAYMGYLNQYENRDPFSYDFNSDALYQQYKDQYIQQGQLAMMDTMGQAAAMTGGYGNSYAQTVGQQAYNQQLGQLNEIMPELYGMAYDRYTQEGQDMLNMYNTYLGLYQNDYGMHQDTLDRWYQENTRLQGNYDTLYDRGYDNYMLGYNTALNEYNTDRSEAFTSSENEKSRSFTENENAKDREVKVATSSSSNDGLKNVSSTSMGDIITTVETYSKKGNDKALESYLDGLVAEGRITLDQALDLYGKYRTGSDDDVVDTSVTPIPKKFTGSAGGSGGGVMYWDIR